jgi:hypothetical protein
MRKDRISAMSETPKKKPAKSTPAKKQAQKKSANPKGTGKPGRPKKVVTPEPKVISKDVEEFLDELERVVAEDSVSSENDVVIHATSVKKESLRKRMLKWFK